MGASSSGENRHILNIPVENKNIAIQIEYLESIMNQDVPRQLVQA